MVAIIYIKAPVGVMAGRGAFCLCRLFTFKSRADGHFTEVMLIASDTDLMVFKNAYGIDEIKTEY